MAQFDCFDPEFQDRILACWIKHPEEFAPLSGLLHEEFFSQLVRVRVARALRRYFAKHERWPPWDVLVTAAKAEVRPTDDDARELDDYLERLREVDTDELDFVVAQTINFFKTRALVNTLNAAKNDYDKREITIEKQIANVIVRLDRALRIGTVEQTRTLIDYAEAEDNPDDCLLGRRFLCREGACLLPAPTGVGKSSTVNQMTAAWACGRAAFGIKPAKPLKILVIQAEDDAGDMKEMASGIITGLSLSEQEFALVLQNTVYVRECALTGEEFIVRLQQLVREHRPDLFVLNPLNAYIGGKGVIDAETVSRFCRNQLNPILIKYRCGNLTVHHTAKPSKDRNPDNWRPADWVYAYAGSNELANWCRAMLAIDPTHEERVFRIIGAKRGSRLGWKDEMNEPTSVRYFTHATKGIFWSEASEEEIQRAESKGEEKRRGRGGRKEVFDRKRLLRPLQRGKPLLLADWLKALHEQGCAISRTRLKERAEMLEESNEISRNKSGEWFIVPEEGAA
jgi:hypothetical protein